jgi:S1-C subfamily serine protease
VFGNQVVMTNAHVVAGVASPQVRDAEGRGQDADVVLFDPELDVAVLRVEGSLGPPLSLTAPPVERGAPGVVAGYPGGGTLTGSKAAVRRTISALGRDIYGTGEIQRQVIELQGVVRPGNSGGPFVLEDGSVGGLVFAASPSDPKIGYAIDASEIDGPASQGVTKTTPVATGRCVP